MAQVSEALQFNPVKINVHSGLDAWSHAQRKEFFTEVCLTEIRAYISHSRSTHICLQLYYSNIATKCFPTPATILTKLPPSLPSRPFLTHTLPTGVLIQLCLSPQ
jgi:hypothetical protein